MNKNRRKKISVAVAELQKTLSDLEQIKDEEDDSRENIPENLKGTEMFNSSEDASDVLQDAIDNIQEAIDLINEIT